MRLPIRNAIVIVLFFFPCMVHAQPCDCLTEFEYIKHHFEQNHPGFQLTIRDQAARLKAYNRACTRIEKKIRKTRPAESCIFYLEDYITLLRDHHISIDPNLQNLAAMDESSDSVVASFMTSDLYTRHEVLAIDVEKIKTDLLQKPVSSIEGIYQDRAGTRIGIVKNKKRNRDYAGILLQSNSRLWKQGQVKLELKQVRSDLYDATFYTRSFARICERMSVSGGKIPFLGLSKIQTGIVQPPAASFSFRAIDGETNYLQLRSFDAGLYAKLDSLYSAIDPLLRSKPGLIVDLRDNGGGSERCYYSLLKYVYSGPMHTDTLELWVTPGNIQRYREYVQTMKRDSMNYGPDAIRRQEDIIKRMEQSGLYSFIPMSDVMPAPLMFDSILPYPQKVVVLQNRNTASAAEGFIFFASQSDKVITAGENTGGYVGFGNVLPSTSAGGCYILNCTTMKYGNKYQYEFTGIPPRHRLRPHTDWLEWSVKRLKE